MKNELTIPINPPLDLPLPTAASDERGWWFSTADQSFSACQPSELCAGFEESLATLQRAAEREGPFDGVLGFSQGAALVGLLCALQQRRGERGGYLVGSADDRMRVVKIRKELECCR